MKAAKLLGSVLFAFATAYVDHRHGPPALPPAPPDPTLRRDLAALGLDALPDAEGLKAAWREAARRTHPDVGGDAGAFQAVTEAYERLKLRV